MSKARELLEKLEGGILTDARKRVDKNFKQMFGRKPDRDYDEQDIEDEGSPTKSQWSDKPLSVDDIEELINRNLH